MNTTKKRRPDRRAIRETKTYTVRDLSVAARKSEDTVREWIRQGLPTIDEQTPTMIYGHSARDWLDEKWAGRRHKTAMGELYCCGCQQARAPVAQTIRFKRLATGAMNVQAQCCICGALMNRCIKIEDLAAFQTAAMTQVGEVERFIESHTSSSNPGSSAATPAVGTVARESNGRRRRARALPCNPRNERLKHAFFEFCHNAQGRAERSIRTDEVALLRFESHFGFRDFGSLSKDEAIAFKNHLRESELTVPVIVATLSVVNKFLGWLATRPGYKRKVAARDYLNLTTKERRSAGAIEKIVPSPSPDDVDQAIGKMPAESCIDKRNRAMIALLGLTAIRSTALTTLRLKHVDLDEGVLHQRSTEVETKFSKNILTILVPVKPGWLQILEDYVAWLRSQGFSDNDPLFPKTKIEGGDGGRFGRP